MRRWYEAPILMVFPIIGLVACAAMYGAIRRRRVLVPFACGMAIFAAAFATLAVSFYPYMVPFSITISDAASPTSSLAFMFWGEGLFVFPLMLIYNVVSYSVFRGKVHTKTGYH